MVGTWLLEEGNSTITLEQKDGGICKISSTNDEAECTYTVEQITEGFSKLKMKPTKIYSNGVLVREPEGDEKNLVYSFDIKLRDGDVYFAIDGESIKAKKIK